MDRTEAIKELKAYQNRDTDIISNETIEMCIKSLKDKKARYWKRRWLKQRENIYTAMNIFESLNRPSSALMLKIICLGGGDNGLDSGDETGE